MTRIRRLLVANRGEIAIRIIRACRELGIESYIVHSEADSLSLPVQLADHRICIGPAPASLSYLKKDSIVGAAVAYGVDAIHPGYGFLSENAEFSNLCESAGIRFVGPPADIIKQMGDKIEARKIAMAAKVPTIPGSEGSVRSLAEARRIGEEIGYPILIKAAAGGGGRGMRILWSEEELETGLSEASAEAAAAFGDGSVYIEKYFTDIRHVEVQVLGDGFQTIHIGERDCSPQRRNQKLIEEAPCSALDEEVRVSLLRSAIRICNHVGYKSAGTVEFVYNNSSEQFYFIEMNTRIQVEHPVTEMVTGIDLVKEQIRIAETGKLGIAQAAVEFRGHAIECRINAEDPDRDFMPCPGIVTRYRAPGGPGIRVDSHLQSNYCIPPFYDSLVAKIISWGSDRLEAIDRMKGALQEIELEGIKSTVPLHLSILNDDRFKTGKINTSYVTDLLRK